MLGLIVQNLRICESVWEDTGTHSKFYAKKFINSIESHEMFFFLGKISSNTFLNFELMSRPQFSLKSQFVSLTHGYDDRKLSNLKGSSP